MSTKTTKTESANKPKAESTVMAIAEQVLAYRTDERPTLSAIFRVTGSAARMLRLEDREQVANAAALKLAEKHKLLGAAG